MSTDHDALLKAICAHPDEDTPRLAFADWLQENGQPERAEFIRAQVELERLPEPEEITTFPDGNLVCKECHRIRGMGGLCRVHELRNRERILWRRPEVWFPAEPFDHRRDPMTTRPEVFEAFVSTGAAGGRSALVRRGFIESVIYTAAAWLEQCDQVTVSHPVTRVVLMTLPEIEVDTTLGTEAEIVASLLHRNSWHTFPDAPAEGLPKALLKLEWPRIKFKLPGDRS